MIPIISISGIVIFVFLLFATIKVYSSYRKRGGKIMSYYLKVFISFDIASIIFMSNGILIKNLEVINLIFNLYTFFYFLALAYFTALIFEIIDKQTLKKVFFSIIVIFGFTLSFISAFSWQPAVMTIQEPFVFWEDARGSTINNLTGIGLAIPTLWIIIFFLYKGIKSYEKYVRIRSFFLSGSMICFLIASITDFIFGANPNIFYISIYTCFWAILAIALFVFAIYYKQEKSFAEDKV